MLQTRAPAGHLFFEHFTNTILKDSCRTMSLTLFLCVQTHAPIFVRKTVWNEHAASLTDMTQQEFKRHLQSKNVQREAQTTLKATRSMLERHMDSSSHAHTLIRYLSKHLCQLAHIDWIAPADDCVTRVSPFALARPFSW